MNKQLNEAQLSRRDFLKLSRTALLTASGILGLGGLLRFLSYPSQPSAPSRFDLGPSDAFAPASRTVLPQVPALLFRGPAGFHAFSLVCTHLGCTVELQLDGLACPCHGSRFNTSGQVTHGPASKPLLKLRLETNSDGHLILFTD